MAARAFITGLEGLTLSHDERAFLRDARPWGLIIFKRNVSTPDQVTELTQSFRDAVGSEAPVLVDQEGGRVQRLGPPHWPTYPPGARYSELYDQEPAAGIAAARLAGHLIAADLRPLGIDVDCLPIADVPVAGGDPVIGDRAYGSEPGKVAKIAKAIAEGLEAGGVLPVVKHLPGHGRATKDSHHKLPVVDTDRATLEAADFAAFKPLAGLPLGMTAHVVFSAIDPVAPATTSVTMVRQVIRGFIGFQGLLLSAAALRWRPDAMSCFIATAISGKWLPSQRKRPSLQAQLRDGPMWHLRRARRRKSSIPKLRVGCSRK